jgi:hypothetical protein
VTAVARGGYWIGGGVELAGAVLAGAVLAAVQLTDNGRELLAVTGEVTSRVSVPENVELAGTLMVRGTDPFLTMVFVPPPVAAPVH